VASLIGRLRGLLVRVQVALFTAAGVTVLVSGLLTYEATAGILPPPQATPTPTPAGDASPTPIPSIGPATSTPTPQPKGFASRIVIPALDIDMPVVQAPQGFPYCNVAQYVKEFSQPGQLGSTVIGAHARTGMFLPIHDAARIAGGASMVGMLVLVYTNDNRLYLYEVDVVLRQQTNYDIVALPPGVTQQLVITTSEDGRDDPHKIMVRARYLYDTAADPARANPPAHIVVCS
jgi:sortase (surface protein transpeptidase)